MASIYALHDISGQVAWVEEEFLNHPVFGAHLIEVPYGTKPYNEKLYSGNPERLREKLAKDLADAEAKPDEEKAPEKHGLADAVQLEQNEEAGAVVPDLAPAEKNLPEFEAPEPEAEPAAKPATKKDAD